MNKKTAYFERIPAIFGDSFAMSDNGVSIHETEQEILDDIALIEAEYRDQAKRGERDPDDCELDSYPIKVTLTDTGQIFDDNDQNITSDVLEVMRRDANIEDPTEFINEIIYYVNKETLFCVWIDINCGIFEPKWELNSEPKPYKEALTEQLSTQQAGFPTKILKKGDNP